jgi:hypothetical protein
MWRNWFRFLEAPIGMLPRLNHCATWVLTKCSNFVTGQTQGEFQRLFIMVKISADVEDSCGWWYHFHLNEIYYSKDACRKRSLVKALKGVCDLSKSSMCTHCAGYHTFHPYAMAARSRAKLISTPCHPSMPLCRCIITSKIFFKHPSQKHK